MPFCQIDLGTQCSVTIDGNEDLLTGSVMNSNCTHFERCVDGVLETTECTDGTVFHVNGTIDGADVGGGCVDARTVDDCDVDECNDWANTNVCPDNTIDCTNLIGSHNCTCDDGYTFNDNGTYWDYSQWSCDDFDECLLDETNNCHADANCTNTIGSYECECNEGLFGDGVECYDSDECAINGTAFTFASAITGGDITDPDYNVNNCSATATCENAYTNYTCECNDGYYGDGTDCLDGNECGDIAEVVTATGVADSYYGNHNCSDDATCTNIDASFECACNDGYFGDGVNCTDIDECDINNGHGLVHNCNDEATCDNFPGGFNCTCNEGWTAGPNNGTHCENVDECTEVDVDGFALNDCHANATCTDTMGSWNCTCDAGFNGNGTHCEDVDECVELDENNDAMHNCNINANCTNIIGSWECTCLEGYFGDGVDCGDSDECGTNATAATVGGVVDDLWNSTTCDENAACLDDPAGSYNCSCNTGYEGDGWTCEDIDECANNSHDCHIEATCNNTIGAWECDCNDGWFGNGTFCEDIDECDDGNAAGVFDDCDDNASCDNFDGGYNCTCNTGYEGDGHNSTLAAGATGCADVDECLNETDDCHADANCTNIIGSWECDCNDGYYGNGTDCENSDECDVNGAAGVVGGITDDLWGVNDCSPDATCTDTVGSFNCTCDTGYSGNGTACENIDECDEANGTGQIHDCDENASCTDTIGAWECACNTGFEGNGTAGFCADIDECDELNGTGQIHNCTTNASCNNTVGAWECSCDEGYWGTDASVACDNIDECETDAAINLSGVFHECHNNATCADTDGNYTCTCDIGYEGDGFNCTDIDECANSNLRSLLEADCHANAACSNTDGSYECACNDGYYGNGTDCANSDECALNVAAGELGGVTDQFYGVNLCHVNATCSDTDGNYTCACNEGFDGDGFTCEDIDECADPIRRQAIENDCHVNAACTNTIGSYECGCNDGYFGNGTDCANSDECAINGTAATYVGVEDGFFGLNDCHANATCSDTDGNYTCACDLGYGGDGFDCQDIDECADSRLRNALEDNCHDNAGCTNTDGSYECGCNDGYFGDGIECANSDECSINGTAGILAGVTDQFWGVNSCHVNATCSDTDGNYTCACNDGFEGDGFTCEDIDECADPVRRAAIENDCHADAACTNTIGSYECGCNDGYFGNGTDCENSNECGTDTAGVLGGVTDGFWDTHNCDANANCTDNVGSFDCACNDGYSGNGTFCEDVNECDDAALNQCHADSDCMNLDGGYNCTCHDGYVDNNGDGFNCTDFDECADASFNDCADHAICMNEPGTYSCSCTLGYDGNGTVCEDIDECDDANGTGQVHDCDANAGCTNTDGAWNCTCNDGYFGDGVTCEDFDECDDANVAGIFDDCSADAACNNTIGSFECTCNDGYIGNGTVCEDVDECDELDVCHAEASCHNYPGSFNCTCNDGWEGDGLTCTDIDECVNETHDCHANATCTNIDASWECECNVGYAGNGTTVCDNIDECTSADLPHDCDVNAICTDTDGSYECACMTGGSENHEFFTGDGMNGNCAAVNECDDPALNYCDGVAESCVDRDDVNVDPGYDCVCNDGFQQGATNNTVFDLYGIENIFDCDDIDECADPAANDCSADAICGNTYGSYNCTCATGYAGNGTHCEDIDECTEGSHECDEATSTCNNFDGAYDCGCNAGFANSGTNTTIEGFTIVVCDDVDECTDISPCHANATCDNTFGGFNCTCADGYVGDGDILDINGDPTTGTCDNVDECDAANGSDFVHNCHGNATCTDTDGSFECQCDIGYEGDGVNCTDVNECDNPALRRVLESHCVANAECSNTDGSYECACAEGWEGDGLVECTNIDECTLGTDECHDNATCTDNDGSYDCECLIGFSGNGTVCEDVDECAIPQKRQALENNCDVNAGCVNTIGSYECGCNDGYSGDGLTCSNVDECDVANGSDFVHNCALNATCTDTEGSFECECDTGYSGNGTVCEDVDECANPALRNAIQSHCVEHAACTNTDGSYECGCDAGYEGDGLVECTNTDECLDAALNDCHVNATCSDTEGSYECECDVGFQGNGTACEDIDECLVESKKRTLNCDVNAGCTNSIGSFACGCNDGWTAETGTALPGDCVDVDECLDAALNDCHANATCSNNDGGFECACDPGYTGDGVTCDNVNECDGEGDGHSCDVNADCSDNDGSFDCACHDGWVGDGFSCTDYDECADSADNNCDVNANCTNIDGSFECACSTGWMGDGTDGTCTNADECTDGSHTCSENAVCDDLVGSFNCTCNDGFNGDGFTCEDLDECASGNHDCTDHSSTAGGVGTCTNIDAGYECGCIDGYYHDVNPKGKNRCNDVNECWEETHNCHANGECVNSVGAFECACATGFDGDGVDACDDIDECDTGADNCDTNASCSNSDGSFECACNDGYEGDGVTCTDIDECATGTAGCDPLATCENTDGSFTCTCIDGYEMDDAGACGDVDECADSNLNDCNGASGATCNNGEGSYFCSCPDGFGGAGTDMDPCNNILGNCDAFAAEGYVLLDGSTCDTVENSICQADCDTAADFYSTGDGSELTFDFRCTCTGDRSSADSLTCAYELIASAPTDGGSCVSCPSVNDVTWFGTQTNTAKRSGPSGGLVISRVQPGDVAGADYSDHSIILMLQGDWSQAKVFAWIYDIDLTILEADATSTMVVMRPNANTPTLKNNEWLKVFIGFGNAEEAVNNGVFLTYKVGIIPGQPAEDQLTCLPEILAASPEESELRKRRREARQRKKKEIHGENYRKPKEQRGRWQQIYEQTVDIIFG